MVYQSTYQSINQRIKRSYSANAEKKSENKDNPAGPKNLRYRALLL